MSDRHRRVAGVLLCCLGVLTACRRSEGGRAGAGAPGEAAGHDALRDEARLVLEQHCGQCHIPDYPTALPRALAVFDLREPDWSARMTNAQLDSAIWRLGEPLAPDGNTGEVTPEERARFQRYVDAERARRARRDGGIAR